MELHYQHTLYIPFNSGEQQPTHITAEQNMNDTDSRQSSSVVEEMETTMPSLGEGEASSASLESDAAIAYNTNTSRATVEDDILSESTAPATGTGPKSDAAIASEVLLDDVNNIPEQASFAETATQAFSEGLGLMENDDDSFTTIKTEKSVRDNYKVEFSFADSTNLKMEIANTSFVRELQSSNATNMATAGIGRRPPLSNRPINLETRESHLTALSALTEEREEQQTIDSEGAVGVNVHEDDAYSIATERSFTGALINLVIREGNDQSMLTEVSPTAPTVSESLGDTIKDDIRQEKADDDLSVVTAE